LLIIIFFNFDLYLGKYPLGYFNILKKTKKIAQANCLSDAIKANLSIYCLILEQTSKKMVNWIKT